MNAQLKAVGDLRILLVEDSLGDAMLLLQFLRKSKVPNRTWVVRDGMEALEFLRRQGNHRQAPVPDLILLDLNLPRKDGREVLAEVKADPDLANIPVLVISTSKEQGDIIQSYESRANFYMIKPRDLEQYRNSMKYIEEVWMKTIRPNPDWKE